jgi:predicted permease
VTLLACTLLLVRSTLELLDIDPGFDPDNLLTLRISLPGAAYDDARIVAFNRELVERVATLPGVIGAAAIDRIPLTGNSASVRLQLPTSDEQISTNYHGVTPGYFDVMGMRLLAGRGFTSADADATEPVAIINELLAEALFGDRDPLGQTVPIDFGTGAPRVIGLVNDVKVRSIEEAASPAVYVHAGQLPDTATGLVVRSSGEPAALINPVRAQVAAIDPALDIYEEAAMRDLIDASPTMLVRTIPAMLLSGFAAFATLLVALGLFAVVGHDVASRTREIGVRRALGALPAHVMRDVTAGTLAVVAGGIVLGTLAAVASARLLQSMLYGVGTTDPIALATTAAGVLAVAALACLVPARRAVNVDPTEALRSE